MLGAFEVYNSGYISTSDILLLCDHASGLLPAGCEGFISDLSLLDSHIGVDIGAGSVCRFLSDSLRAPAILGCYSRLYIDLNRPLGDFTSIRCISDGVVIAGNCALSALERERREAIFREYHDYVSGVRVEMSERLRDGDGLRDLAIIFVHSFTPIYRGGVREWHLGVLSSFDKRLSSSFLLSCGRLLGDYCVGDNEPYSGEAVYSYSMDIHGGVPGHLHFGLEIRQDLLGDDAGVSFWGERLGACILDSIKDFRV